MTEDMFLPVSINGRPADYGLDTGMDLSVMNETEAGRLGMDLLVQPRRITLDFRSTWFAAE